MNEAQPTGTRWDTAALRAGASVAAVFAVPPTLIARFAFDDTASSGWAGLLTMVAIVGFVLGAGVAAWRQDRGTPFSHGLVTTVGVFVATQVVFTIVRVLHGGVIRWGKIYVGLALAITAGVIGGMLGSFLQRRGVTPYR